MTVFDSSLQDNYIDFPYLTNKGFIYTVSSDDFDYTVINNNYYIQITSSQSGKKIYVKEKEFYKQLDTLIKKIQLM